MESNEVPQTDQKPRLDELLTIKLNWAALGGYPKPRLEDKPNQQ